MMMMCHWMVDGELIDNYYEFFIYQTQDTNNLDIWNNRYKIRYVLFKKTNVFMRIVFHLTFGHRESMVPAFFTKEDVNNIFHTGRYIHFLHTICESKPDLTPSRKVLKDLRNSGG